MGIGHTNSSQFGLASIPAARRPFHLPAKSKAAQRFNAGFVREGVADLARHPLNDPTPAGATIARVRVQTGSRRTIRFAGFPELGRDGHKARPVEVYRQRGRQLPAIRPELFTQLLPTGRATKRVLS